MFQSVLIANRGEIARRIADGSVWPPRHRKVLASLMEPGAEVHKRQRVAVIEAMKMEHTLTATVDGTVAEAAAEPHRRCPCI